MKLCVVLLVAILYLEGCQCLSDELKELIEQLHKTCVAETGVSEDLITKSNADKKLADDPKFKCYMKCLMAETAVMTDGDIDVEAMIALLPAEDQDLWAPIMRKCGVIVGADDCETAYLTQQCVQQAAPDKYIIM